MRVSHQNDALHRELLSSLIYERSPDTANKLRFMVITGIDRDQPAWYRLLIAPNEEAMEARPGDHFVLVTRIHTMNAETPENLLRFLSKHEHAKAFIEGVREMTMPKTTQLQTRLKTESRQG